MQPTQLQHQAAAMTVFADLARRAFHAGATVAPDWYFPASSLIDGHLTSEDDTAIREFRLWQSLFGPHQINTYTHTRPSDGALRRLWVIKATVDGFSVWMRASVPASLDAAPIDLALALATQTEMLAVAA